MGRLLSVVSETRRIAHSEQLAAGRKQLAVDCETRTLLGDMNPCFEIGEPLGVARWSRHQTLGRAAIR
jgi:hypothetical protein